MPDRMRIKLWGVRGSLPTPMSAAEYQGILAEALAIAAQVHRSNPACTAEQIFQSIPERYRQVIGGETTCVEVNADNTVIMMDAGTGARRAGQDMMRRGIKEVHILITHTHWDHIQGFPFFAPAHSPDVSLHFYSCIPDLEARFATQQHADHQLVSFANLPCKKTFTTVEQGQPFQVGNLVVEAQPLIHPGGSASYKIRHNNHTFVFATDTEFYGPELSMLVQKYDRFFHGAEMLIIDAQYSLTEAEQKRGWGHTAMTIAVDCAMHWDIGKLGLTHHEPAHSDETVRELFARATEYLEENNPQKHRMELYLAREGEEYFL